MGVIKRNDDISDAVKTVEETSTGKNTPVEFLDSGSILINLAASGKGEKGGWARGRIVNLVGDGSSGKTLLALELAAAVFYKMKGNVSQNFPPVKKIRIIYDNAEEVMDFPIAEMYGQEFYDAVEWIHSRTVQAWGRSVGRALMANKPGELVLYITDSLDALTSEEGAERFQKAAKEDKPEEGTYATEKAAYLSKSFFANISSEMAGKDFTLVIISQVREKIGVMFGEKYYRAGGKALDFYTHQVAWLAVAEKLKRTYKGKEVVYGIRTIAKLKRNKTAKPFREAEVIILFDYGLDDIGSNLAYLYGPKKNPLKWDDEEISREELIDRMDKDKALQRELGQRVESFWQEIEDEVKPKRKGRYFE